MNSLQIVDYFTNTFKLKWSSYNISQTRTFQLHAFPHKASQFTSNLEACIDRLVGKICLPRTLHILQSFRKSVYIHKRTQTHKGTYTSMSCFATYIMLSLIACIVIRLLSIAFIFSMYFSSDSFPCPRNSCIEKESS